jgi:hypothetical protein
MSLFALNVAMHFRVASPSLPVIAAMEIVGTLLSCYGTCHPAIALAISKVFSVSDISTTISTIVPQCCLLVPRPHCLHFVAFPPLRRS